MSIALRKLAKSVLAVRDKHLFHISFNEALLIGAANSLVSENNPETIDSVRKSITNRSFLRISENFRKENTETNQTKQTKKTKDLATSLPTAIFGQIFGFFGFLFFFVFLCFFFFFFLFFFVFFCFFCFFVFFGFAGCLGFNPLYCLASLC